MPFRPYALSPASHRNRQHFISCLLSRPPPLPVPPPLAGVFFLGADLFGVRGHCRRQRALVRPDGRRRGLGRRGGGGSARQAPLLQVTIAPHAFTRAVCALPFVPPPPLLCSPSPCIDPQPLLLSPLPTPPPFCRTQHRSRPARAPGGGPGGQGLLRHGPGAVRAPRRRRPAHRRHRTGAVPRPI